MGNSQGVKRRGSKREWVGGRLAAPMYITEGAPYRPDIILWVELPEGCIVGSALVDPANPDVSFGESLVVAMQRPLIGPPRCPQRIRVADWGLADEARGVLSAEVTVRVAETPELDAVIRSMAQQMSTDLGEPASYFEAGRVPPATVEELFRAARLLFKIAPWKVMHDAQVVRVDIPKLGVDGACLSIIGALGESFGLLLFPSVDGWEAFADARPPMREDDPIDLGTTCLSLSFERGADLPVTMRREIVEHRWPVAGPEAYPHVALRERDGLLRPLSEIDVRIISACAKSFLPFFLKHWQLFESDRGHPVCESYSDDDDLTVRFTAPYDAYSLFEIDDPPPRRPISTPRVSRNALCPCGSGKKYKKCHLGVD